MESCSGILSAVDIDIYRIIRENEGNRESVITDRGLQPLVHDDRHHFYETRLKMADGSSLTPSMLFQHIRLCSFKNLLFNVTLW